MNMGDIIFVKETKYKNTCSKCGKEIPKGSSCFWEKGTKNNYHEACKPKPQAPSGMADNGKVPTKEIPGAKFTLMIDKAMEEAIDERARRRLRRARQIVDSEFKDADYSLYAPLLGAVYASLYGEEASIRIEKSRERRL